MCMINMKREYHNFFIWINWLNVSVWYLIIMMMMDHRIEIRKKTFKSTKFLLKNSRIFNKQNKTKDNSSQNNNNNEKLIRTRYTNNPFRKVAAVFVCCVRACGSSKCDCYGFKNHNVLSWSQFKVLIFFRSTILMVFIFIIFFLHNKIWI